MRPYTHVCARCALRFEGVRFEGGSTCPKCADTRHVFDGGEHGAQEKARASLRTFASWRRLRLRVDEWKIGLPRGWSVALLSLALGALVSLICRVWAGEAPYADFSGCEITGWAISLAPLAIFLLRPLSMLERLDATRVESDARLRDAARTPQITAHLPAIDVAISRASASGIARGEERLVSPIGRVPCLAWVIAGTVPTGAFSTASSVPFAIESEDDPAEVDASVASIELALGAPQPIAPDAALAALLERQLAYPREGEVVLAEAVLRSGDPVRVLGPFETSARADGYRGAREIRIFREVKGGPLVIQGPESGRPAGP